MNFLLLCLTLFADLSEFGNPYADIGIVDVKEIECPENKNIQECVEGETWTERIKETLDVEVLPELEFNPILCCFGHNSEVVHEEKKKIWFENKKTVENLVKEMQFKLDQDPELNHQESWVRIEKHSDKKLWRAVQHTVHLNNSKACSYCNFKNPSPDLPGVKEEKMVRCQGHEYKGSQHGLKKICSFHKAKEKLNKVRAEYRNPEIAASEFTIHQYAHGDNEDFDIVGYYRHSDSYVKAIDCENRVEVNSYTRPLDFINHWSKGGGPSDDKNCILVRIVSSQPETRSIDGVKVERDAWQREYIYECGERTSECDELRKKGILFSKSCSEGRCKKKYDMELWAPYTKREYTFEEGRSIYGFNGEFDHLKSYEKNDDFAQTISSILGAADSYSEDTDDLYQGVLEISDSKKPHHDERCHLIGPQVYCCFRSKIARIIQEHVKGKDGWGDSEKPNCDPLSKEDMPDLEKVNFSEAYEDLVEFETGQKIMDRLNQVGKP